MTGNENPNRLEVEWPGRVRKITDEEDREPWWMIMLGALVVAAISSLMILIIAFAWDTILNL